MFRLNEFQTRFFEIMERFSPYEDNPEFVAAVSGGSDSLALTFLLNEYLKQKGGKLIALTVDHGLRKESEREAKAVHECLLKHNIYHETLLWEGDKPISAIEEKAREARYNLIFSYMKERGLLHLFVAHTKDEQAETFLLRLRRGSGVDGLSAIKEEVLYRDLRVLRPLLSFTRAELREYLNFIGEKWIDDPSNFDTAFERVKMRKLITYISDYGLTVDCLTNAVANIKRAKDAVDFFTNKAMAETVSLNPMGYIALDKEKLLLYPEEIVLRVLSRILFVISGNNTPVRMAKIINLKKRLFTLAGGVTLGGCFIKDYRKKVVFIPELNALPSDKPFKNQVKWGNFYIEAKGIEGKVGALRAEGYKQIKKFIKKRCLSAVIYGLPAIFINNRVTFVPHLGYYANKNVEINIRLDIEYSLT